MSVNWNQYSTADAYDELLTPQRRARPGAGTALKYLRTLGDVELHERRGAASVAMQLMGITFTVYNEGAAAVSIACGPSISFRASLRPVTGRAPTRV